MITIELNEFCAEDARLIGELKQMGIDEDVIQIAYNNTQKRRIEEGLIKPRSDYDEEHNTDSQDA